MKFVEYIECQYLTQILQTLTVENNRKNVEKTDVSRTFAM